MDEIRLNESLSIKVDSEKVKVIDNGTEVRSYGIHDVSIKTSLDDINRNKIVIAWITMFSVLLCAGAVYVYFNTSTRLEGGQVVTVRSIGLVVVLLILSLVGFLVMGWLRSRNRRESIRVKQSGIVRLYFEFNDPQKGSDDEIGEFDDKVVREILKEFKKYGGK